MDNKITTLFKNLCCSVCKADFDENSIKILRKEKDVIVIHLKCNYCGKEFGTAFLGTKDLNAEFYNIEKTPLKMIEDKPPISKDDVIDAHEFIKELDEHWSKYLPEDE